MRPQQQNRRMRGRSGGGGNNNNNNNNRRGPNPLTRSYESNGPDVKIRGSAQQIAEKYTTLARDAMSSGDRVIAENYLQHAEHYNRIIMTAQAQLANQQVQAPRDDYDDDMDDGGFGTDGGMNGSDSHQPHPQHAGGQPQHSGGQQPRHQQPQQHQPVDGSGPQPDIEGVPAEVALNGEPAGQPTGGGRQRGNRRDRFERRHNQPEGRVNGVPVEARDEQPAASQSSAEPNAPVESPAAVAETPAAAVPADEGARVSEAPAAAETQAADAPAAPKRGRRPRRPRETGEEKPAQETGGPAELAPAEG